MLARIRAWLKWCLIIAISVCVLVFTTSNTESITLSLFPLPLEAETPKFLLVLISFGLGVMVGGMLISVRGVRWRLQAYRSRQRTAALENENAGLRSEVTALRAVQLDQLSLGQPPLIPNTGKTAAAQ